MKKLFIIVLFLNFCFAHPVSYTINLDVSYDKTTKMAKVMCTSNSKNKCGLYNIRLLDINDKQIVVKRFPFLRESVEIKTETQPKTLDFFLRKVPEHIYKKIFE